MQGVFINQVPQLLRYPGDNHITTLADRDRLVSCRDELGDSADV